MRTNTWHVEWKKRNGFIHFKNFESPENYTRQEIIAYLRATKAISKGSTIITARKLR